MKKSNALLCVTIASVLLIGGCKNKDMSTPKNPTMSETANSTTPVSPVGTTPAGSTKEATATTSKEQSDVSKTDQSASMPLPGQANDHSVLVPKTSEFPKTSP